MAMTLFSLTSFASATAQDGGYKVSAISVGSGETPISGGISASVDLTTESGGFMQVMVQSEQAWFMIGKDWKFSRSRCSFYGSVGHFQSAPWVGPYAGCTLVLANLGGQEVSISALTWPGFYIGWEPKNWRTAEDGVENPESLKAGYFSVASLNLGRVSVSIAHLNFLDDKTNILPGVAYTQKVRSDMDVSGSFTWNSNSDSPMFFVGASWHPKK
ncbi:MAG: hypothetical protein CEO12_36 [Parcubacteria group bacterium Gr01-1014_46]|nr:MAG: hypothetical protein CEO12_36 [Parcubacteria group bacterium Gr01-1014_46]